MWRAVLFETRVMDIVVKNEVQGIVTQNGDTILIK
jgi:hypothetical protein